MIEDYRFSIIVSHEGSSERPEHISYRSQSSVHIVIVIASDFLNGSCVCRIGSYRTYPTPEYAIGVDPDILLDESGI